MINERWVGWITLSVYCWGGWVIATHIARVEGEGIRSTFGTTPEWLASGGRRILRQAEQELLNRVVVFVLEQQPPPNDAFVERQRFLGNQRCQYLFSLLSLLSRVLEAALEVVRLAQEGVDQLRWLHEQGIEQRARPLCRLWSV